MTIFDDIKDLVDVPTAARSYGVEVHQGKHGALPVPQGTPPVLQAL